VKVRVASLFALILVFMSLAALPATAQLLYDNGPVNGNLNAWPINFGFAIADSFSVSSASNVTGFEFGVWALTGDTPASVGWEIGNQPFAANLGSGTSSLSNVFIGSNNIGYDVYESTAIGLNVPVAAGTTYFLTLQNAVSAQGQALFWDENDGVGCGSPGCPSTSYEQGIGQLSGSESFQINGTTQGTVPEPGSMVLFGSGLIAVAGAMRRKINF
jgi:hypothetical protein